MTEATYCVISDYRDPRLPAWQGNWETLSQAADRAAEVAFRDRAILRQVVIINRSGVVVASHSLL